MTETHSSRRRMLSILRREPLNRVIHYETNSQEMRIYFEIGINNAMGHWITKMTVNELCNCHFIRFSFCIYHRPR